MEHTEGAGSIAHQRRRPLRPAGQFFMKSPLPFLLTPGNTHRTVQAPRFVGASYASSTQDCLLITDTTQWEWFASEYRATCQYILSWRSRILQVMNLESNQSYGVAASSTRSYLRHPVVLRKRFLPKTSSPLIVTVMSHKENKKRTTNIFKIHSFVLLLKYQQRLTRMQTNSTSL